MLVLDSGLEDGVLPVRTLTEDARVGVYFVGLALDNPAIVDKVLIVFCVFAQVHHVETLDLTVNGQHTIVAELGFASLTALGGDEHHAVGTLGTIDGGGGGVLQNLHRHDVAGVQR